MQHKKAIISPYFQMTIGYQKLHITWLIKNELCHNYRPRHLQGEDFTFPQEIIKETKMIVNFINS